MVTKTTKTKKTKQHKTTSSKTTKKAKIIYNQEEKRKNYIYPILLLLAAIIIVGFVSNGTFFLDSFKNSDKQLMEGDQIILVTVNEENIYQSELNMYWDRLPPQIKLELTKDDLLEEFIQERLLLQEAKKLGITVNDNEVDEYITAQLGLSGLTLDQFEEILTQQGTTVDEMKNIYRRQITLAKLFEQRENNNLESTKEEIEAYFLEHREEFFSEEQVTVQHILIPVNENLDDETAKIRVSEVEEKLAEENNENFCELVTEYSADPGSVSNCGEYTFGRGAMVQEFEEAGFNMVNKELRTVKTDFGYHIMLKIDSSEAKYLSLEDSIGTATVSETVQRVLAEQKARSIYDAYINELKEGSEIIYPEAKKEIIEEAENNLEEITGNIINEENSDNVVIEIN